MNKLTIEDINNLYVKFHEEAKKNPELNELAEKEFKKMEDGDMLNLLFWRYVRRLSIEKNNKMYDQLGIRPFDVTKGESDYACPVDPKILDEILDKLKCK